MKLLSGVVARDAQSGAVITYRLNAQKRPELVSVKLVDATGQLKEIDPKATYTIVTIDYLLNLASGNYSILQQGKNSTPLGITLRDAVTEYVKAETAAGRALKSTVDRRFVSVDPDGSQAGGSALMITRRKFLASSAAFSGALLFRSPDLPFSCEEIRSSLSAPLLQRRRGDTLITILHTNDTHSQIDAVPANDKLYPGKGGVARRATLVKRVRKENPNTLLIDAGDVFQGTPYFNFYKGEVEYKAMSEIGYDAGTLGNHEFDNGVDALAAATKFAKFALVSANYDVRGTPLENKIKQYVVREVGGVRIGLFGLGISPVGLITPANFKGITYRDPVIASREVVKVLKEAERCSLIVGMSHLGYNPERRAGVVGDSQVAAQVDHIDFIASGHNHTFMDKPVSVRQPSGKETLIFQVGKSGIYVGRVDFTVRAGKVVAATGRLLDLREESLA